MRRLALVLVLLSCASVTQATSPITTYNYREVTPTPMHYGLWLMAQQCVGRPGPAYEDLRWFVADSIRRGDEEILGFWSAGADESTIVPGRHIVLERGLWFLPGLIVHELLHDIYGGEIPGFTQRADCIPAINGKRIADLIGT